MSNSFLSFSIHEEYKILFDNCNCEEIACYFLLKKYSDFSDGTIGELFHMTLTYDKLAIAFSRPAIPGRAAVTYDRGDMRRLIARLETLELVDDIRFVEKHLKMTLPLSPMGKHKEVAPRKSKPGAVAADRLPQPATVNPPESQTGCGIPGVEQKHSVLKAFKKPKAKNPTDSFSNAKGNSNEGKLPSGASASSPSFESYSPSAPATLKSIEAIFDGSYFEQVRDEVENGRCFQDWVSQGITNRQLQEAIDEIEPLFDDDLTPLKLDAVIRKNFGGHARPN